MNSVEQWMHDSLEGAPLGAVHTFGVLCEVETPGRGRHFALPFVQLKVHRIDDKLGPLVELVWEQRTWRRHLKTAREFSELVLCGRYPDGTKV